MICRIFILELDILKNFCCERFKASYLKNYQAARLLQTSSHNYDENDEHCSQDSSGKYGYYTLGAVILSTGALVAYAKQDDEFRNLIKDNFPVTDKFISFVTAEEVSQIDYILQLLADFKDMIVEDITGLINKQLGNDPYKTKSKKTEVCDDTGKPFRAPTSAFKPMASKEQHEKYEEARISEKKPGKDEDIKRVIDSDYRDKNQKKTDSLPILHPDSLVNLEKDINKSADQAIRAYNLASCHLRDVSEDIYRLLNVSVEKADKKLWAELKKKSDERTQQVEKAEEAAEEAERQLKDLQYRLEEPDLPGGDEARSLTKRNIIKVLAQLHNAKQDYDNERNNTSVTERLWTKVLEARQHFLDEIETLHPNFRVNDKEMKLPETEMNLFVKHAILNALHLQTEFVKIDTIGKMQIRRAVEMSHKGDPDAVDSAIEQEIDREKRKISMEYYKKLLTVKAECEQNTKQAIENEGLSFDDTLADALEQKEKEVMRKLMRAFDESLMDAKEVQREEMAGILGKLQGMDDLMKERACKSNKSKLLWSASEALQSAVTSTKEHTAKPYRSLDPEIHAIINVAPQEDEFVHNILAAIPHSAVDRGVYSAPALRERYVSMARVAKRVGFIEEGGASLPVMLIDYLKSLLIISPSNPISCFELMNEPFDPESLDNFEILQRSKFYMDRGDWYMVLGYLNLLKGASRVVAQDYINEMKLYLEMKLIADSLLFYSSALYLAY